MNPYVILGVKKDADAKTIKSAYRKLSSQHHPDKGGEREKFEEVKFAFDVLSNVEKRKRYDTTGRTDQSPVTPEAIRRVIGEAVRSIITAQRPDGSTDDPIWDDVREKVIQSIRHGRKQVQNNMRETQRKMERTQRLIERFKSKTDADPVGDILRAERASLDIEMHQHEDAMEMSVEVEKIFLSYDYEVGPGPEGQYSPGPPLRRGVMFLSSRPTGGV